LAESGAAGRADAVYLNGAVWAGDAAAVEGAPTALAIARGRVIALGDDREIRRLAGRGSTIVDLGGRRVVPGLIDGHIHAVRAGATWDSELHWTGMPDVRSALASVAGAAARGRPGEWIRAVGGWHPSQFTEGRAPSREELDAVTGEHPVYVQALYDHAVLNTEALRRSGIDQLAADPPGGSIERDADGRPTGRITGLGAFSLCLAALPRRGPEEERAGLAAMVRELHANGLTGLVDPGGFQMPPRRYDSLFELWRRDELRLRMRLFLSAVDAGQEVEQLGAWLEHGQSRFGDDMLQIIGIGEVVHFGCHDFEGLEPFEISDAALGEFEVISRQSARRGWPMHVHAVLDSSIDRILDCWEKVNAEVPLAGLRFSLAHADRIGPRNIARLRTLGVGVVLDDHLVFKAEASRPVWGDEAIHRAPPIGDLLAGGVPLAAGTDATRASSYSPWLSLWWLVTGRSLDGVVRRAPEHLLSRARALAAYTSGSAWLSFEDDDRGHLRPGARADLVVLDRDYFTVDEEEIPTVTSVLTVVGGDGVHSSGAVAPATPGRSGAAGSSVGRAKESAQ
jgi:predicted amidohydrolase YtcJ